MRICWTNETAVIPIKALNLMVTRCRGHTESPSRGEILLIFPVCTFFLFVCFYLQFHVPYSVRNIPPLRGDSVSPMYRVSLKLLINKEIRRAKFFWHFRKYLDWKRSSGWFESWEGLLLRPMFRQPVRKPSSQSRWLPHRLSKCQSQTTVLQRTPITQMIFFNQGTLLLGSNHFLSFENHFSNMRSFFPASYDCDDD